MTVARADFDLPWFERHLLDDLLPHWLANAVTEEGLFLPHLDRRWRRRGGSYGTLVSQARLLYNFTHGYRLTGRQDYLLAVKRGARFLIDRFRDREYGGWVWSCAPGGRVLDAGKDSYGHAFVVFGLAHACQCTEMGELGEAALEAWEVLSARLRDRHGGLVPRASRDFSDVERGPRSQNPVMHLFEALLALSDVEGLGHIREEARRVADFVLTRLVRQADGALPELYTQDWIPLSGEQGGRMMIGHQFEWAYLLSSAVERGMPERYLQPASDLLGYGLRVGYDPEAGGVYSHVSPEEDAISQARVWWAQCEAARALLHFALLRGRSDLQDPFKRTMDLVKSSVLDEAYGGWYMGAEGAKGHECDKGSHWKVDYHAVGLCVEAVRLSGAGG